MAKTQTRRDPQGYLVIVSEAAWAHMAKHEPDMKNMEQVVLGTIEDPDEIMRLLKDPKSIVCYIKITRDTLTEFGYIKVVARRREAKKKAYVMSAYPVDCSLPVRRIVLWRKPRDSKK